MKKNMATAMAAAMAFGAVVPAFAAEISPLALAPADGVDMRLASGLELYGTDANTNGVVDDGEATILKRADVYNYNGAAANEYSKHTIKDKFKNATIVYEDKTKDEYVLAQKSTNTAGVAAAKAKLDNLNKEIAVYVANGYSKSEDLAKANSSVTGSVYKSGIKTATLTKTGETTIVLTFSNVDNQASQTEIGKDTELTNTLRKETFGSSYVWDKNTSGAEITGQKTLIHNEIAELSKVKYIVSKNASKFDIVKEETGTANENYNVKLYRKGAAKKEYNLVANITVAQYGKIDKDKIVNVPVSNDFASHWASNQILNAMLAGDIDASAKFRPEDGITRAEFAKMVAEIMTKIDKNTTESFDAYSEDKTYTETFHDVVKGDWFQNYVAFLQETGVVQGDGEKFRPNDKITREEVAIMLTNALDKSKSDNANMVKLDPAGVNKAHTSISKGDLNALKFKDKKNINIWADHSVKYLSEKKYEGDKVIAGGDDKGYFNPTKNITRAEALVMVQRTSSTTK